MTTKLRYSTFPRTKEPAPWTRELLKVFRRHHKKIQSPNRRLSSNAVLKILAPELTRLGFDVEKGTTKKQRLERSTFYGENGKPTVRYLVDAHHREWRCGLEIEAGRGWKSNAVHRDLVQALTRVDVKFLVLAVRNIYRYRSGGKIHANPDYEYTRSLCDAIFGHRRLRLPYSVIVIGY